MTSPEQSIIRSMDGDDPDIIPFLPYILQDVWEIGAEPQTIIHLIKSHYKGSSPASVLDLGCGKGAVSVNIAARLGFNCYGIDAIPEFIEFCRLKSDEYNVTHLCTFEIADIRERIKSLNGFDIIILGAIGPVLGDYFNTFYALLPHLNPGGIIVIDDGYISDDSSFTHPQLLKEGELKRQVQKAGMQMIAEEIFDRSFIRETDAFMFDSIRKRCTELSNLHPGKKYLFDNYIKNQEEEFDVLENKIITSTMVFARHSA
jgi:cyclopropane fatty-acyl-phospholipid synthase-like methyltransferase